MVQSYMRRKKQIIINLPGLLDVKEAVSELVVTDKIEKVKTTDDDWDPKTTSSSEMNLISPDILSIYPNVKLIIIKAGISDESYAFPFNMVRFLDIIGPLSNYKSIKVSHYMLGKEHENKSWTAKLWNSSGGTLIDACKKHKLEILFEKKVEEFEATGDYFSEEYFSIVRV